MSWELNKMIDLKIKRYKSKKHIIEAVPSFNRDFNEIDYVYALSEFTNGIIYPNDEYSPCIQGCRINSDYICKTETGEVFTAGEYILEMLCEEIK
jgi:hypothetical protein